MISRSQVPFVLALLLLACSGCDGLAPEPDPLGTPQPDPQRTCMTSAEVADETAPVVIVGGGVAGMAVATALDEGLLLDAADSLGGRALLAGGMMFFYGLDEDVEDSPEQVAEDWPALTGSEANEATLAWLADLPEIHDRLTEMGVGWGNVVSDPILHLPRNVFVSGGGATLAAEVEAELPPGVEVRLSTTVADIWMEGSYGCGVVLQDGTRIGAGAVVIASGGFAGVAARVGALSEVVDKVYGKDWAESTDSGAQGAALDWADAHGWGTAELDSTGWFRKNVAVEAADGRPLFLDDAELTPWIWVDSTGARFVDEGETGSLLLSTPYREHSPVWAVIPSDELTDRVSAADAELLAAAVEAGEDVVCAESTSALATAIDVDPDGLEATLEEVAAIHANEAQDSYGRRGQTFPSYADVDPCAFRLGQVASKSFGGLAVDLQGRMLDADGEVMPGLYAVGEAAGMAVPGLGGLSGFDGSLSAVIWSGWRVGAALAEDQG